MEVYESKKNRCATTPALYNYIAENEKHLLHPSNEEGQKLREVLRSFTSAVSSEYRTTAHLNSELILCSLSRMEGTGSKCFLSQFHRGISCPETEFEAFEDQCAQGKISTTEIDYSQPVELLIGFSLIHHSPVFLIRLTAALVDYMAYTSNSDLQQYYTKANMLWSGIRLKSGMKVDQFAVLENETFAQFAAAAAAAQRSVPSSLDRGLTILKSLPSNVRTGIDKLSRKKSVPENLMDRNWVVAHMKQIERESNPKYSWAISSATNQQCTRFMAGTCNFGTTCRYLHTATLTPDLVPIQNSASMATAPTDPDNVTITCLLKISDQCTKTFDTEPAYWASLKTADGKPFSLPKSCKPCRDLKKKQALAFQQHTNASMFTEIQDIQDDQHENDGADDDYYAELMNDHCMMMSDAQD